MDIDMDAATVLWEWFDTAKQVVFSPTAFFSEEEPNTTYVPALLFAAISLVITGILSATVSALSVTGGLLLLNNAVQNPVMQVVMGFLLQPTLGTVVGIVVIALYAGVVHGVLYLFGERNYLTTLDVFTYTTAVQAFFGWIPVINVVAGLYAVYVQFLGVRAFHNTSSGKAAVAVLTPVAVLTVLILVTLTLVATHVPAPSQ